LNGDFTKTPFPQVLWDIFRNQETGALEVKRGEIQKKVVFDGGYPVHVESNLLHETLGRFLVNEKVITSDQEQKALVKSIETQKRFGEALIEIGAIQPAQMYEALKKSSALKILDVFNWEKGFFTFAKDSGAAESVQSLKMNPVRLLLKGVETTFPMAWVERSGLTERSAFRVAAHSPIDQDQLQLGTEDVRILTSLKGAKSVADLQKETSIPRETLLRKLYAFRLMGLVVEAEAGEEMSLDELVSSTLLVSLKPAEAEMSMTEADAETRRLANQIASEHMKLMGLNYFELLNLQETATAVEIRNKFVEFAACYSPGRFKTAALGEFRDRVEELFLRGVKAFSTLSDFDSKTKYRDKLKGERKKAEEASQKKKPGDAFKIQTKLLDADSQFELGLRFLRDRKFGKAIELFAYCADIDGGNPVYLAHWGWAIFQAAPERNAKQAEEMLKKAMGLGANAHAAYFLGKLYQETLRPDQAVPLLKAAVELDPKNIEMVRDLRSAEKAKK
jgi:tetratricopeptide (TPR) repeat protein